jgi:hypothetical protein
MVARTTSGQTTGLLRAHIGTHLFEALHRLSKQCIVEAAGRFKMGRQMLGLLRVDPQRQFHQEGWGLAPSHDSLACLFLYHLRRPRLLLRAFSSSLPLILSLAAKSG